MAMEHKESFTVIGLSVRTTNENGQSGTDIPVLWARFFGEGTIDKIPGKTGTDLYCIYTDYEKDHTKPYTTVLGCCVKSGTPVPEGMTAKQIAAGAYEHIAVTGNLKEGIVFKKWQHIWNSDLPRNFCADFEIYGAGAANQEAAEVEIWVGIH